MFLKKKRIDERTGIMTILTLCVILLIALEYAKLHSKYDWLYSIYATYINTSPPNTILNVGPTRIVLAYERPWVSNLLMTRPLTPTGAEFLIKLIKVINIPALYLASSTTNTRPASVAKLNDLVKTEAAWMVDSNVLYTIGKIPYKTTLVSGYVAQIYPNSTNTLKTGDLSLQILWLYGYEEYVRERFTWSATSVLEEWNYMFALTVPAPTIPQADGCSGLATNIISNGTAWAGIGAMVGSAAPGIGTVLGTGLGFIGGCLAGLFEKFNCL